MYEVVRVSDISRSRLVRGCIKGFSAPVPFTLVEFNGLIARGAIRLYRCQKITITDPHQKPGAIAFFVENKVCSALNKVQRGRRLLLKQAKLIEILKNNRRML